MKTRNTITALACALVLSGLTMAALSQEAAAPTIDERVTAIKANLAQSSQNLKTYQWTETQVVNFKGEDKSNKEFSCAYSADGKVVKTLVSPPSDDKGKPGVRGKIIAKKKEEMSEYMQSAVALVKSYIPPDPAKIQTAKDAGKVSMTIMEPGKRMKIDVKDYEKPGDDLGIVVDMTTNKILGLSVASYLADAKDAVTLDVTMDALADGTGYPSTIVLDGVAQQIKVTVTNGDYKKAE